MLIVMTPDATQEQIETVCDKVRALGFSPHPIPGELRVAVCITGNPGPVDPQNFQGMAGVTETIHVTQPYKLTSRDMRPESSIVQVGDVAFGGPDLVVVAGPCSVESPEQTIGIAHETKSRGGMVLRGGAFKPRTSPYSFQGLKEEGLKILAEAREQTNLPIVSEVVDTESFDLVERYVDMIQIGSRNMQNYSLLKRAGRSNKPVLLKRWMSGTLKEFLLAAEYIMSEGNKNVVLCERGIRAFSDYSRFTLDITIVPKLKQMTHLPVVVDPSHAAGHRELVAPLALSAVAAGADGILVEVHPEPEKALSDGPQALTYPMFASMMEDIHRVTPVLRPGAAVTS